MGTLDGVLELHPGEMDIPTEISFANRHEIAAGQTITGTPTMTVLDVDGDVSTDLTVSGVVVDGTGKIVQFKVTANAAAVVGNEYEIKCAPTFSGGAKPTECLGVVITPC